MNYSITQKIEIAHLEWKRGYIRLEESTLNMHQHVTKTKKKIINTNLSLILQRKRQGDLRGF